MKMAVFWNIVPCSLVDIDDVSEVLTASIIRAMSPATRASVRQVIKADWLMADSQKRLKLGRHRSCRAF
jgi:hypothetical protein